MPAVEPITKLLIHHVLKAINAYNVLSVSLVDSLKVIPPDADVLLSVSRQPATEPFD